MSAKNSARAIADAGSGTILATVEITAPPELVFRALTTPDEIVCWWGSDEVHRTTGWTADPRVGGRWRAEGRSADGQPHAMEGEFLEVDPPHNLVQTWKPDWLEGPVTTLTYRLEANPNGTRLIVRHEAADEAAVRVFEASDPAIQSKRGFRYEILPMPSAKF